MKKIYFLLTMLLFTGLSFGQEVLVNGGFETWTDTTHPDGWTHVENTTQESTEHHGGTYSAKHVSTSGTKDLGQTISGIIPGDTYELTINYKVESGDGSDVRIWSKWKAGSTFLSDYANELQGPNSSYLPSNTGTWSSYTTTMVAPATATDFYFEVRVYSGAVVYWDDFSFNHVAATTPTLTITSPTQGQVFNPAVNHVNIIFAIQAFTVGTDGYIKFSLDGSSLIPLHNTDPIAWNGLSAGNHAVHMELVNSSGVALSPPVTADVTFTIGSYTQVSDIATLRGSAVDHYYHLTGETFVLGANVYTSGNVKGFVQDATGGIMVFVPNGTTTNHVNLNDGLRNLKGKLLTDSSGILKLELIEDFTTTGNNVPQVPQVVTVADFNANPVNYESELIQINNATIDHGSDANFVRNHNYNLTVGTAMTILRAAFNDFAGTAFPAGAVNVVGIGSAYHSTAQIFPRQASDLIDPAAIGENNIEGFNAYPNPITNGQVFVTSDNDVEKQVTIYNVLGKVVLTAEVNNNQAINVSQLKAGIYMMSVNENGNVAVEKLIIK